MKIAIPDLISNSYFPALAAIELGFFAEQGLDVTHELIFPVDKAYRMLRDGEVDCVAGAAHAALSAFPDWQGVNFLCALSQGMYWFLVMHKDFAAKRGELDVVKGKRIGAAPWVDMGLRAVLREAGYDLDRDGIEIAPPPMMPGVGANFGLSAAGALEERKLDGFWANGMGAEVAVRRGIGDVVLDVRRAEGHRTWFNSTFATLATTAKMVETSPEGAAAMVRAIDKTHAALKADVLLATAVGRKFFPPDEAELIAGLIQRDLPYYSSQVSSEAIDGLNRFAQEAGLVQSAPPIKTFAVT